MYITPEQMDKALRLGWTVEQSPQTGTSATCALDSDLVLRLWETNKGYQTALHHTGGNYSRYILHTPYTTFDEAITRLQDERTKRDTVPGARTFHRSKRGQS